MKQFYIEKPNLLRSSMKRTLIMFVLSALIAASFAGCTYYPEYPYDYYYYPDGNYYNYAYPYSYYYYGYPYRHYYYGYPYLYYGHY